MLTFLCWVLAILGICAVVAHVVQRLLSLETTPQMVVYTRTMDGWRVALLRYEPAEPSASPPVLLLPGLGQSARIFDLGDVSLARQLAARGHDVWVLEPRGSGLSESARLFGHRRASWCFDQRAELDLPAAIDEVCRRSGAPAVFAIGVGLGGLAALVAASSKSASSSRIAGVAALGATAFFRHQREQVSGFVMRLARLLPVTTLLRLGAPLLGRLNLFPLRLLYNADNVDPPRWRRVLTNVLQRPSGAELKQLSAWVDADRCESLEERDYRAQLAELRVPTLLVVGPRDKLAAPAMVQQTLDLLVNCEQRTLVVAGRAAGMSTNYGHLDMLVGQSAARDVFPVLAQWLERGDTRPSELHDAARDLDDDERSAPPLEDPLDLAIGDVPRLP